MLCFVVLNRQKHALRYTHICSHEITGEQHNADRNLSLQTDILKFCWYFPSVCFFFFCRFALQSKGEGGKRGFVCICFFSLKSAWPISDVYFCDYGYDQHIPNKPVSSPYVQF